MIHKYKLGGKNFILDINSGAVHIVDDIIYDMADYMIDYINSNGEFPGKCDEQILTALASINYNKSDIEEAYSEMLCLYESGLLFSKDDYEKFNGKILENSPVKAICLHIAHDCNLRCGYCFASTGDFGHGRKLMDADTGKKSIDFLIKNSGERKNLEVDFFGGEPLMNFEVIKEIVEYARSKEKENNKNFRFTVTTNGLLLDDDKIDYINREMSNVVLSLDGRKKINDKMRPAPNGKGSYDIITEKYRNLVKSRIYKNHRDYYIRGTFTKHNLDFSEDVMHINSLGFDQISVEPVMANNFDDYAITETDLPQIFEEYENLAKLLAEEINNGSDINFFHFMIDLEQGPCVIKRLRGCGCGNEYLAVTPDGDIYPCHQFVGKPEWKLGNLSLGIEHPEKKEYFAKTSIFDKDDCKKCWAKFYCSGGCNANNYIYESDVLKPHKLSCEMEKKRIECAIMLKALILN